MPCKYVNATGDEAFLCECGAEMLVETARLWYDLGFFSARKGGKFCLNGVTGPDEYNTVVNNNTYTNLMARENLRYASETVEVLLEIGEFDKAVNYARVALLMGLADVGGNVRDGCHIASMGETWMVFTYGFGGLRDYDGRLSFRPQRPPEAQASLHFPLTYRGQILDVKISPDSTTYTLREGEELVIRHEDEEIVLNQAHPAVIRLTLKP